MRPGRRISGATQRIQCPPLQMRKMVNGRRARSHTQRPGGDAVVPRPVPCFVVLKREAYSAGVASTSTSIFTSSDTSIPPASSAAFHSMPQSLRFTLPLAEKA